MTLWLTLPAGNNLVAILLALTFNAILLAAQSQQRAIWDRFFFNVELPLKAVSPLGRVKLLLYHRYPTALSNLKIRVSSELDWIKVTAKPSVIKEVEPTVIEEVTLHFHCQPGVEDSVPDTAHIAIEFETHELGRSEPVRLVVPLTAAGEKEANELLSIPIGEIEVRIGGLERALYYGGLICAVGLVVFLIYRKHRLNRVE
ncbi:MAG: hypothetical protein RMK18_10000 [Armatimonadota bacterium]|nr:hypothetical protein [Armatimonadota bacterium]MCX7778115.1 hypothetical protein [Armatimonadota bacterium]MDW8026176.1 hypothetical protein [Armatimonadota bacterium]